MDLSEMFGLAPQQAAPADAGPAAPTTPADQGGWPGFLSDPRARAGLISAGLQAMVGGWGNGVQQLGASLGAGAQGYAGQDKLMYDRAQTEKEMQAKASEGAANRAQSETNARIGADSRMEVAQTKTEGMLQRAALIRQPQNSQEMKIANDAAQIYLKKEKDNQLLSKKTDAQINEEARAWGQISLHNAREATGVRSQGAALPGDVSATSGNPADGGAPVGPVGAGGAPKATSTAPQTVTLDKLLKAPGPMGDQFRQDLQSPEGQARIIANSPRLKEQIDAWNYAQRHGQVAPYVRPDVMNSAQTP